MLPAPWQSRRLMLPPPAVRRCAAVVAGVEARLMAALAFEATRDGRLLR